MGIGTYAVAIGSRKAQVATGPHGTIAFLQGEALVMHEFQSRIGDHPIKDAIRKRKCFRTSTDERYINLGLRQSLLGDHQPAKRNVYTDQLGKTLAGCYQ